MAGIEQPFEYMLKHDVRSFKNVYLLHAGNYTFLLKLLFIVAKRKPVSILGRDMQPSDLNYCPWEQLASNLRK